MEYQLFNSSIFDQKDHLAFNNSWDRDLFRKTGPSFLESSFDNTFWKFDDSKFKHLDSNLLKLADLFRTQNEPNLLNHGKPNKSINLSAIQDPRCDLLNDHGQFKSQMAYSSMLDRPISKQPNMNSVGSISTNSDLDSPKYDFKFKESPVAQTSVNTVEWLMEPDGNRTIVGRGINYYKRFGTQCIYIPPNPNLPPNIQPRSMSAKTNSFKPSNSVNCQAAPSLNGDSKGGFKSFKRRPKTLSRMECVFCKNNQTNTELFRTHWLKDSKSRVICPVLRAYNCPICNNGGGDFAHTYRYCPERIVCQNQRYSRISDNSSHNNSDKVPRYN